MIAEVPELTAVEFEALGIYDPDAPQSSCAGRSSSVRARRAISADPLQPF
jgi:hypothetical protein